MPDGLDIQVEHAVSRALVSLRVARGAVADAVRRLRLAPPLSAAGEDPQSLWLGPDHWLLASRRQTASAMVERCAAELAGVLHNAVDQSAAFSVLRVAGRDVREVLASGAALDFRESGFPPGGCRPTRFAQVGTAIVATGANEFELYVDRAYGKYLRDWLEDTVRIAERAVGRHG